MSPEVLIVDKKKHVISIRLDNTDRNTVQNIASRLYVRESEIYRFAINFLLNRIHKLNDTDCTGSDLLPLFIEFKEELHQSLNLKKQQLFKIINSEMQTLTNLLQWLILSYWFCQNIWFVSIYYKERMP